ncbi:MAG TPA: hypothetical protein GX725_00610 [Mollicutes bacterium]|nr:hypothetical protein [Mollicutes bacterium]
MKLEKLKKLSKSKYFKPLIFFGFYFVFFTVIIVSMSPSNYQAEKEEKIETKWQDIKNNYEYLYEIEKDDQVVILEGKKHNNKNLFTKKVNDDLEAEVYVFYNDISIKTEDDKWEKVDDFILVDESFNEKLLDINYLKEIIEDSEFISKNTNFDESISEKYKYNDIKLEVTHENNILRKITFSIPSYNIELQYKKIGELKNFVVEK